MDKLAFLFLLFIDYSYSQIHFPTDYQEHVNYDAGFQTSSRLHEDVDAAITKGIAKMTLSIGSLLPQNVDTVAYSPANIAGALSLVLLGANGKTFDELANVLGLHESSDDKNTQQMHEKIGKIYDKLRQSNNADHAVKVANAIFIDNNFQIRDLYKQLCQSIYNSEIINLNFNSEPTDAKNFINNWIAQNTDNKITSLMQDDPPATTKIVIASALYFKAAWEKPFLDGFTKQRPFYPDGRNTENYVMFDMMSNGGTFPYYRDSTLNCEIMGFPYKGNKATMYVVMPFHSNKKRLIELQGKLSPDELERLVQSTRPTQSAIGFPKMTLESSIDLSGLLQDLGVKTLFNPYTANLALLAENKMQKTNPPQQHYPGFVSKFLNNNSKLTPMPAHNLQSGLIFSRMGVPINSTNSSMEPMGEGETKQKRSITDNLDDLRATLLNNENPGLYADQVLHKVYMDISEYGTEAAAATSVSLSRGGDITTFRVDVPFLFFIKDHETRMILFWGTVFRPTPNNS